MLERNWEGLSENADILWLQVREAIAETYKHNFAGILFGNVCMTLLDKGWGKQRKSFVEFLQVSRFLCVNTAWIASTGD